MASFDLLLEGARLATFAGPDPYGLVDDGAVAIDGGRLMWVGPRGGLPAGLAPRRTVDCGGRLLTPGLVDCHTHLVWGGDRVDEFELRLTGVPYAEIARRGGGIVSTVKATRAASDDTLFRAARRRLDALVADGVTTAEVKSGYGLDLETELRCLRIARRLGDVAGGVDAAMPVRIRTTFLGAHAVPPEYLGRAEDYLETVIDEVLPAVADAGLADAVDAFCEGIAFSVPQVDRLFTAARARGLPVKLHAEQLSLLGGAALAARHGALSADHLEYLDEAGVRAMAEAGTVAVLLPGAFYFLRESQAPPVELLRRHGVPMAVATDLNPGSSPVHSLLTTLNLACVLFGLTPAEALAGATRVAARALGLGDKIGTLEAGKAADLALWNVHTPAALVANLGDQPLCTRFVAGRPDRLDDDLGAWA
ncbi:MAG: imidazolonepropionase [Acidobacteriota bacterium]